MSSGGGHGGGLPFLHVIEDWLHNAHKEGGFSVSGNTLFIAFAAEIVAFFFVAPGQSLANLELLLFLSPLWIPLVLWRFSIMRFIDARKVAWLGTQETVLLEIRLPRDTRKTPLSMETVFSSMHIGGGENTWYKRIIQGRARPWYSYELVSLGGRVHFYVWTRATFRRALESFLYAQYPGVEVIEAIDYSRVIDPSHAPYTMAAFEYAKTQPDPYPVKTYVDYGLDRVQKPEEQTDPLAQVLETLGSIGPKEQVWVQFVVRIHRGEKYGGLSAGRTWKDVAKEEIEKIRKETLIETEMVGPNGTIIKSKNSPTPTEGQRDRIKAIERNVGKQAYDVGVRAIYCAPEEAAQNMGGIVANLFKAFGSEQYNSLMPNGRWSDHFMDYPWEDKHGHHLAHAMHSALAFYRRRAFFHPPYVGQWNTLSVEELATLYHIPSSSITTPSLPRIQSSTSEAPSNLPI